MGLFDKIREAKTFETSNYIEPGLYTLKIDACKTGETRHRVPYTVVECKVVWSSNPKFTAGASVSWYVGFDKDAAQGNIKSFLAIAMQKPVEEIDPSDANAVFSQENPLRDEVIDCEAFNKPTREGKPFTRVKWLKAGTLKAERDAAASTTAA